MASSYIGVGVDIMGVVVGVRFGVDEGNAVVEDAARNWMTVLLGVEN